jgi:hypothetical protein
MFSFVKKAFSPLRGRALKKLIATHPRVVGGAAVLIAVGAGAVAVRKWGIPTATHYTAPLYDEASYVEFKKTAQTKRPVKSATDYLLIVPEDVFEDPWGYDGNVSEGDIIAGFRTVRTHNVCWAEANNYVQPKDGKLRGIRKLEYTFRGLQSGAHRNIVIHFDGGSQSYTDRRFGGSLEDIESAFRDLITTTTTHPGRVHIKYHKKMDPVLHHFFDNILCTVGFEFPGIESVESEDEIPLSYQIQFPHLTQLITSSDDRAPRNRWGQIVNQDVTISTYEFSVREFIDGKQCSSLQYQHTIEVCDELEEYLKERVVGRSLYGMSLREVYNLAWAYAGRNSSVSLPFSEGVICDTCVKVAYDLLEVSQRSYSLIEDLQGPIEDWRVKFKQEQTLRSLTRYDLLLKRLGDSARDSALDAVISKGPQYVRDFVSAMLH